MIKKISEYLTIIFNKLYSVKSTEKLKNKVLHTILKNDLTAKLKNNEQEILFGCGCFWGAEKGFWRLPGVISTAVGYAGGVKITNLAHMRRTYPERIIENAVKGMLPHNKLGRRMLKHLKVYAGSKHPHNAQRPETLEI